MTTTESQNLPDFGQQTVMSWLFKRSLSGLTREQLDHVRMEVIEVAEMTARHAQAVAKGVAYLVESENVSGAFQESDDVAALAHHFALSFGQISDLLAVAAEAKDEIWCRQGGASHS